MAVSSGAQGGQSWRAGAQARPTYCQRQCHWGERLSQGGMQRAGRLPRAPTGPRRRRLLASFHSASGSDGAAVQAVAGTPTGRRERAWRSRHRCQLQVWGQLGASDGCECGVPAGQPAVPVARRPEGGDLSVPASWLVAVGSRASARRSRDTVGDEVHG